MLKTLLELGLNGSNESAKRLRSWQISSVIDTHLSFLPLGICYKILSSSFPVHSEEVFFKRTSQVSNNIRCSR